MSSASLAVRETERGLESGRTVAISGQGVAPRAATIDWFRQRNIGLIPGDGLLPATVPAAVDT